VQSKESYDENGWVGRSWLGVLALMLLLGKLTASQALPVILIAMVFLALTGAAFMKNMGHFRLSTYRGSVPLLPFSSLCYMVKGHFHIHTLNLILLDFADHTEPLERLVDC
jgi:hypothetical protein